MTDAHPVMVILSTASPDQAPVIARALLNDRLVACVNILPVRSSYWWNGEICSDDEQLLVMKTRKEKVQDVISSIQRLHRYDLPEIIVLPVAGGSAAYLEWVVRETSPV